MKESIKDISLNPDLLNIDEKPLGGKSLSSIMSKNSLEKPAKGLASLISAAKGQDAQKLPSKNNASITQTKTQVTTEFYPSDVMINNEFLRLEREKNDKLHSKLEQVLEIPEEVKSMKSEISGLKEIIQEAMSSLGESTEIPQQQEQDTQIITEDKTEDKDLVSKFLKSKKSVLYAVIASTLILGMGIGQFVFGTKVETKIVEVVKKEAPKPIVKKAPQFVTTKFVNVRSIGSSKGKVLFTISPNQTIEVLDKKAGWWKMKYQNLLESKTYTGWVYFENLKKI